MNEGSKEETSIESKIGSSHFIDASPTKRLFIDILTQDIDVKDCILDLVDNSIDGYIRTKVPGDRDIRLLINSEFFEIFDNCGGIDQAILEHEVFRFGRLETGTVLPTLGVYGIGMKRSIFKMGKILKFETDDGQRYNLVNLNIEEWKERIQEWTIPISDSTTTKGEERFTRIRITRLHESIRDRFSLPQFIDDLERSLAYTYAFFTNKDISIFLNERKIEPPSLTFMTGETLSPEIQKSNIDGIEVEIICFIQPRDGTRMKRELTGWNVFVNDRLILFNDTSEITGWTGKNSQNPKYHQIFNDFSGFVFMRSNDTSKLPIATTKNRLSPEHPTYIAVLSKMMQASSPVIRHLSKKYVKEIEEEEKIVDNVTGGKEETAVTGKTVAIIGEEHTESTFKAPEKPEKKTTHISYEKPKSLVDIVKSKIGAKSNKEVGEKTFDYYVDYEDVKDGECQK